MVFSSVIVLGVAHVSAEAWQQVSCCIPTTERISSHQMLDLVCCFPLQQLGRFALCLWNYLCLSPPSDTYYDPYYYSSDDADDDDDDDEEESSDHHHHYYIYYHHHTHDATSSAASSSNPDVDLRDDPDPCFYNSHSD